MPVTVIPKEEQGKGAFNNGQILENKPLGFPQDNGLLKPYSNLILLGARLDRQRRQHHRRTSAQRF